MSGMMFGEPPTFQWVIDRLAETEAAINRAPGRAS
jgi:hypothetical protein